MAKRKESHGEIDWAAADVADGVLTVPLTGDPSDAWARRAGEVVGRLGGGRGWGDVDFTRKKVTVADVQHGSEDDLRHLLEGAVMQANADFAPDPPDGGSGGEEEAASGPDAELAEGFRAFAPDEPEGGEPGA